MQIHFFVSYLKVFFPCTLPNSYLVGNVSFICIFNVFVNSGNTYFSVF